MTTPFSRRQFLTTTAAAGTAGMFAAGKVVAQGSIPTAATTSNSNGSAATNGATDQGPLGEVAGGAAYKQPSGERELVVPSLDHLEEEAREIIPAGAFAYIAAGADRQITLRENRKAFDRIRLLPEYLVGKDAPDLRAELLGERLSMPIITAPMGAHGLAHTSAEIGSAKGTGAAGTLYSQHCRQRAHRRYCRGHLWSHMVSTLFA